MLRTYRRPCRTARFRLRSCFLCHKYVSVTDRESANFYFVTNYFSSGFIICYLSFFVLTSRVSGFFFCVVKRELFARCHFRDSRILQSSYFLFDLCHFLLCPLLRATGPQSYYFLTLVAFSSRFSTLVAFSLTMVAFPSTLVALSIIYADASYYSWFGRRSSSSSWRLSVSRLSPEACLYSSDADDGDSNGYMPSPLEVLLLGNLFVAPVNVTKYIVTFCALMSTLKFTVRNQDGDIIVYVNARFSEVHDIGVGSWNKL